MTHHVDLHDLTHTEKAQQALAKATNLSKEEVDFLQACVRDLADDGQLENHRHYVILDALWKKSQGFTS